MLGIERVKASRFNHTCGPSTGVPKVHHGYERSTTSGTLHSVPHRHIVMIERAFRAVRVRVGGPQLWSEQVSQQDDSQPVTVFKTNDPGLLAVAQSLLEEADIEFFVAGEASSGLFPGGAASPFGSPEIRVAAEHADEARALLKGLS